MKRLLITGISGFLGSHFNSAELPDYELIGTYFKRAVSPKNINCLAVDWSDFAHAEEAFFKIKPDAVIHLAALSNPNYCEQNPKHSYLVNFEATVHLAGLCKLRNIPFIFCSTDLVFDGENGAYGEKDMAKPICIYGQHKLLAENKVLEIYREATIARLPLMFGLSTQGGFMQSWINQLKLAQPIFAFTDEFRTPASASCIRKGLLLLLEKECTGLWHLGGKESISRFDLAVLIADAFDLPKDLLRPSLQKEVQLPAARPQNVSLNSAKAFGIGFHPKKIKEALSNTTFGL